MIHADKYPHVFSPLQVGPLTFKNRLGFAPMVCNQCTIDGTVTDAMVDFVTRQASTGVAYVTIGDTQVDDERGGAFMSTLNIARRTSRPGLTRITEAARYQNAILSVELNHSGRGAKDYLIDGPSLAPSALLFPGCSKNVKEMDAEDLETVKGKFVSCAKNCVNAGFQMLMVHCAHNNLLGQFLSPLSNVRTDEYGGSPEKRQRYPLEVLKAVREAVGPKVAIEIRVSGVEVTPGGLELEESISFMVRAQEYCDIIHVSRGIVYDDAGAFTMPTFLRDRMLNVELAREAKKHLHVPVAVVGNFSTLEEAESVIAEGAADVVCMARAYLADHEMIEKCLEGEADRVRPCLRCHRGCIDNSARGKTIHCAVNPGLGFEPEVRMLPNAKEARRVLVVGGGPAGMQAALTLREKGHEVILCEKDDHLGGLLVDAAAPSCKQYMKDYLRWLIAETMLCGAEIRLNTEVTAEMVAVMGIDAVLVGTGSEYMRPPIPGIDLPNVVMLREADAHPEKLGEKIVICGGGSSGLETALSLAREGRDVTVVDMLPLEKFANGMPYLPMRDLMNCLSDAGVKLLPEHKILCFTEEGVRLSGKEGEITYPADSCVVALGVKRRTELFEELRRTYAKGVSPIGDCEGGNNIYDATHSAYFAALNIL